MPTSKRKQCEPRCTSTDAALWKRFRVLGDDGARAQLLTRHIGLVYAVARRLACGITSSVELDELVSAGTLGLAHAVDRYDPDRGTAFSTFAGTRIRGAVLDELRSRDWLPRSIRAKYRALRASIQRLESDLGRHPTSQEIADTLGMGLAEYWRFERDIADPSVAGAIRPSWNGHAGASTSAECAVDSDGSEPLAALELEDDLAALRRAIAVLPARERTVLALYYYEELTLRQIADLMHVTESRISQIRANAIRQLRDLMAPLTTHDGHHETA
jgi:RNA polymerase sigma factor for flagellar operon FliA